MPPIHMRLSNTFSMQMLPQPHPHIIYPPPITPSSTDPTCSHTPPDCGPPARPVPNPDLPEPPLHIPNTPQHHRCAGRPRWSSPWTQERVPPQHPRGLDAKHLARRQQLRAHHAGAQDLEGSERPTPRPAAAGPWAWEATSAVPLGRRAPTGRRPQTRWRTSLLDWLLSVLKARAAAWKSWRTPSER